MRIRLIGLTLFALLTAACSPTSAPPDRAVEAEPSPALAVTTSTVASTLPPGTTTTTTAVPEAPSTTTTTEAPIVATSTTGDPLEAVDPSEALPVVEPAAAPGDIVATISFCDDSGCTDSGNQTIPVSGTGEITVPVTLMGDSVPDPQPPVWDWYVNGGPRLRDRNQPSIVSFDLILGADQAEAIYTIVAETRYRGWASDDIQITLLRASPTP